jgi:hypothetical protein
VSTGGIFDRLGGRVEENESDDAPLTMSDILDLPDDQRALMRHVMRAPTRLTAAEAAEGLGWEQDVTDRVIGVLSLAGMLDLTDGRLKVAPMQRTKHASPGGMWGPLTDL